MHDVVLSFPDKDTGEVVDRFDPCKHGRISVCHVSEGAAWAGAEVQVATLLRALSKRPRISLHAIVLHEGRLARELRGFGVAVQIVSEEGKSFPHLLAECAQFINGKNIQVLHSHNYKENLIAFLLSRICKVPHLVRTEHGHPEPYSPIRNPKHWCVLAADRLVAKYTDAQIVSVSSDLGEFWRRRVDPQRVMILRNGVDLECVNSRFTPAEAKERLGIPSNSFVVGIAARLECIKRHDLFLETASYLAERTVNSNFIIAGDGRQREFLQGFILKSGLHGRVALLGERKDVYDVLRAMDVLLICSDHEGIPMVMLEAMALGVAVVSRQIGGIPEVIQNGVNGLLVPSDNPKELGRICLSILNAPDKRERLMQSARAEIRRLYSADENARTMADLYQFVCSSQ